METIIIQSEGEKLEVIKEFLVKLKVKFETRTSSDEEISPYKPEFVQKIEESMVEYEKGNFVRISSNEELENLLFDESK